MAGAVSMRVHCVVVGHRRGSVVRPRQVRCELWQQLGRRDGARRPTTLRASGDRLRWMLLPSGITYSLETILKANKCLKMMTLILLEYSA